VRCAARGGPSPTGGHRLGTGPFQAPDNTSPFQAPDNTSPFQAPDNTSPFLAPDNTGPDRHARCAATAMSVLHPRFNTHRIYVVTAHRIGWRMNHNQSLK
jgi:hypothetical protein